ncbi:MAG: hypothetical protein ACXWNJ_07565 [Vulcanimicrobiaceae bacterium]
MIALLMAALIAQSASPSPPALGPEWKAVPFSKDRPSDYASYTRHEQDGTDSTISASRQVCECQPAEAVQTLQSIFKSMPGVSIHSDKITACGQSVDRLIATGLANDTNTKRNLEVLMFRRGPALYTLTYSFRYASPMANAETALTALCPTQ